MHATKIWPWVGQMNRAVVWVSLGLLSSSLSAQQRVVIAGRTDAGSLPVDFAVTSWSKPAAILDAAVAIDFEASAALAGVSASPALYRAALPQLPAAVCTQALPALPATRQSDYAFDHLQFTTAAFKGTFRHDNLVKMARNFVPGQPLPDAPSYVALTSQQKFDRFLRQSHSFNTVSGALMDAITAQATGAYPSFGGGMAGYGKRLGASMAGAESAAFFGNFLFPTLLHQDPRYFRSLQNDISDRMAYAASRVLIGRSDDGRNVINTSLILSEFVQAAVSNAYIPYRNESVPGTIENALTSLGSVAQANILQEFWPDIMTFLSRHEPKAVHHWQDKWNNSSLGQLAKK